MNYSNKLIKKRPRLRWSRLVAAEPERCVVHIRFLFLRTHASISPGHDDETNKSSECQERFFFPTWRVPYLLSAMWTVHVFLLLPGQYQNPKHRSIRLR